VPRVKNSREYENSPRACTCAGRSHLEVDAHQRGDQRHGFPVSERHRRETRAAVIAKEVHPRRGVCPTGVEPVTFSSGG
jgi:hypothetical protein